jgi:hypothetical protein
MLEPFQSYPRAFVKAYSLWQSRISVEEEQEQACQEQSFCFVFLGQKKNIMKSDFVSKISSHWLSFKKTGSLFFSMFQLLTSRLYVSYGNFVLLEQVSGSYWGSQCHWEWWVWCFRVCEHLLLVLWFLLGFMVLNLFEIQ